MRRASEIKELTAWNDLPSMHLSTFKKALRLAWRRHFGGKCQSCECLMHFEIRYRSHKHYATIDHIVARALGGTDALDNLQVICKDCNNLKSIDEYRQVPC